MGFNLGSVFGIGGVIAGGLLGSLFPGPGTAIGMAIGGMLGGTIGGLLFPQKMDANLPPPPKPRENRVQVSTYGADCPMVWGGVRLAGNIIYMQDVRLTQTTKRYRIDGVRFRDHTELYTSTVAVAFCRGEVTAIHRIWVNGKIFADYRSAGDPAYPGDGGTATGNLETTLAREDVNFTVHYGSEDQTAAAALAAILGAAETPAYRGLFYIVFIDFPVGEYTGEPTFEVEAIRTSVAAIPDDETGYSHTTDGYGGWVQVGFAGVYTNLVQAYRYTGSNIHAFLVFRNVSIPENVFIGNAYIRLRRWSSSAGNFSVTIKIEEADNPLPPSNKADFDSRVWSTTTVSWSPGTDALVDTVDISSLIQLVADRPGFAGDRIHIAFFTDDASDNNAGRSWYNFGGANNDGGNTPKLFVALKSYQPQHDYLSEVVSDICDEAGLEAADIDVTDLAALEVQGFQVPRLMPARTALEPLMAAYRFDAVEVDWKLVFQLRGGASAATIAAAELGARPSEAAPPDPMVEVRTQEIELPTHLTLTYDSKARDYEPATQRAVRVDKAIFTPTSVQIGLVMTDTFAKQVAEVILKELWGGRHRYAFSVGPEYLKLAPGDVVTVSGKDMRVVEMVDRDGVIEIAAESEPGGTYTSAAEADDLAIVPPDLAADAAVPELLMFDIPTIDEDLGSAGLWAVLYDDTAGFEGGRIQRSADGGATFSSVGLVAARGTVGECTTTLADGIRGCIDYTASVTVDLADSAEELASASDAELWEGANLCAVGSVSGGWELLQFKTATLVSGSTYTLTGLLRGLYGTERFMGTHAASELFVLLDGQPGIDFVSAPTANIGASYLYRVLNFSDIPGDAVNYATGGLGLECYPPQGIFHGCNAGGDIIITWRRGDRYFFVDGDMPDGGDIDMSETAESYRVRIYDSGDTLKRTITASSQTATWTAAQIATDFPGGTAGAYLLVDQESALTSWGTAARYDF